MNHLRGRLAMPLIFTLGVLSPLRADVISLTTTGPVQPWVSKLGEQKSRLANDEHVRVLPPIREGEGTPTCGEEPTDEEIRQAMKAHDRAALQRSTDAKFTKERLVNRVAEPRFYPLVGIAKLHHVHWKCTVTFTEQIEAIYPFPMKWSKDQTCVVYVDKDHLHTFEVTPTPTAFTLIPPQTNMLLTVNVAELFRKLDIQTHARSYIMLNALVGQLGIDLEQLDRFTFVMGALNDDAAMLFTLKAPTTAAEVMGEAAAEAKKMTHAGKEYYLCPAKSMVVAVLDSRTVLLTPTDDTMKNCLQQASKKQSLPNELTATLRQATTQDVVGYVDLMMVPKAEGVAIPPGVRSATLSLNIGSRVDLQMRVACDNAQALAWSKKTFQTFSDLARGQLVMVPAMVEIAETGIIPQAKGDFGELAGLPMKLMQRAEKGLQKPTFKTDGTNLTVSVAIPINAKELQGELASLERFLAGKGEFPFLLRTQTKGMTLPSAQYLEQYPQYFPADPVPGVPPKTITLGPTPIPSPLSPPTSALSPLPPTTPLPPPPSHLPPPSAFPSSVPLPAPAMPYSTPLSPPATLPNPQTPSVIVPVASVVQPGPMTLKIAVANVHSQTAHIFEHVEQGKPTLLEKVPAGQAIDLKLKPGQRYVAVFTDKETGLPMLQTFTAEKPDSVWLLRPSKD